MKDTLENVEEEIRDLEENIRKTRKELKEKKEIVDDLKNDRKPYSKELKKQGQDCKASFVIDMDIRFRWQFLQIYSILRMKNGKMP